MVEFGNPIYYVVFVAISITLTVLSMVLLKNKSDRFIHIFIFSILMAGFILHFAKLYFEPYASKWPRSLANISFENICAVNTLLFPWIYLSKSKVLKDYMIVIGILGGLGAMLFPFQSTGFSTITFDIIRFYIAHLVLFLAPFLMMYTKQYRLTIKGVFIVPLTFYGMLVLILSNELIMIALGIVEGDLEYLLNPNTRNHALIFGPNAQLAKFPWIYDPFVPDLFKTVPFGPNNGQMMYWPIIWLVLPAYFYLWITGLLTYLVNQFFYKINMFSGKLSLKDQLEYATVTA